MKYVKIIKPGIVSGSARKRGEIVKVGTWQAFHLIRDGRAEGKGFEIPSRKPTAPKTSKADKTADRTPRGMA